MFPGISPHKSKWFGYLRFLHITNMQSVGINNIAYLILSTINLNMGHFKLNAMSRKAETLDIELKIKQLFTISTTRNAAAKTNLFVVFDHAIGIYSFFCGKKQKLELR